MRTAHTKLDAEVEGMTERAARTRSKALAVSPCDLLAYQIGWGKLLLGWEAAERRGRAPEMPARGFKWNQLGALAQHIYAEYADSTLAELRAELRKVVEKIIKMIASMKEAELFELEQRGWAGPKWPLVKWIQVNTIAPYSSAGAKMRKIKKCAVGS